ncbi:MAG: hypothetical protein HPY76_01925 [Anaerolineae bacterium]|nr:hypothetical protein [Anaerolineae bacterium]
MAAEKHCVFKAGVRYAMVKRLVVDLVLIALMTGCSGAGTGTVAPPATGESPAAAPATLTYQVGECDQSAVLEMVEKVEITVTDGVAQIEQDARYVCCAEFVLTLEQEDGTLKLIETNTGEVCRCFCAYHISAQISDIPENVRALQVWGIYFPEMHPLELLGETVLP